MTPALRDRLAAGFRDCVTETLGLYPFRHQAAWDLASRGWEFTGVDDVPDNLPHAVIRIPTPTPADRQATRLVRAGIQPRFTTGVPARTIADLAAYKSGKSWSAARWLTGFAAVPGARVDLVGLQYDIVVPEFDYLSEFLLADPPRGMGLRYTQYFNQPKIGRLEIQIADTGARFEGRSWERKEAMKGKERDCYLFCESYQLPGLHAFRSIAQNLRARDGYAVFPTTPDRPWVSVFHDEGHGRDASWHCTCAVHARENPYTFVEADYLRDHPQEDGHPEYGGLMTREQFAISWEGKLGIYAGRVYQFQRGACVFTPGTHPEWWGLGSATVQ